MLSAKKVLVFSEEYGVYMERFVRVPPQMKAATLSEVLKEGKSIFFEEESTVVEGIALRLDLNVKL